MNSDTNGLNRGTVEWRRVLAAVGCVLAFAVMASVFSPAQTRAGHDQYPGIPPKSVEYASTNPHEGLASLGSIDDRVWTVRIYATEGGPRYSVYEKSTGREMGALLTAEQVHRAFPELQLKTMQFEAGQIDSSPLMLHTSDPDGQ